MSKLEDLKLYIQENKEEAVDHCESIFDLANYSDEALFYSLIFCLLVPAGNARRAVHGVHILKNSNYANVSIDDLTLYNLLRSYVRFPKQKVSRVINFKRESKAIIRWLRINYSVLDSTTLRQELSSRVPGLGYKAASHFLRNIGITDLAIIDVHILKYREYYMPQGKRTFLPTSPKKYLELEKYFRHWSIFLGLTVAHLDWIIWCKESGNAVTALDC